MRTQGRLSPAHPQRLRTENRVPIVSRTRAPKRQPTVLAMVTSRIRRQRSPVSSVHRERLASD